MPPTGSDALDGAILQISGEFEDRASQPAALPNCDATNSGLATKSAWATTSGTTRLEKAFERCGNDLYRFILLRVSNDRHVADDILQQTCFEAARHRRIPKEDNDCQAWLFGIAKNLTRKHFRQVLRDSKQRLSFALVDERKSAARSHDLNDARDSTEHNESVPELLNAIAALDEADQELILGSYFEGRSHEELAKMIGVSVRAIEGRLYRARNALRNVLGPQFEGGNQ
jgi:RNA polymerase sigma-70 factor (ECF subfamily)